MRFFRVLIIEQITRLCDLCGSAVNNRSWRIKTDGYRKKNAEKHTDTFWQTSSRPQAWQWCDAIGSPYASARLPAALVARFPRAGPSGSAELSWRAGLPVKRSYEGAGGRLGLESVGDGFGKDMICGYYWPIILIGHHFQPTTKA